ncbi:MAG: TonB-dependent receptor [Acidobacteriia bacterium]|nr:TonB-dependent receptor [Terriglobia bacterium]
MKRSRVIFVVMLSWAAFAQSDRGSITGVVLDPGGAVVANAAVEARNAATGALYQAAGTATGNYTVSELPPGAYKVSITVPGFKQYVRQSLDVLAGQTLRVDATLEVGAATETITVSEAASLLKTESGELSHNVASDRLDDLPILTMSTNIRQPLTVTQLLPGTAYIPNPSLPQLLTVRVNGTPTNSERLRVEGQDATDELGQGAASQTQGSVDALEEFAIQTSNFAAEFGLAGGVVYNITMKSGSNQFHGSAYEYFANEALNAGVPFTSNGNGGHLRPAVRRNDYGFTFGGPVWIPKVYNGRDKTFFFFSWEQYPVHQFTTNIFNTVPIPAYRTGNFNQALTSRTLGADPLGRPIMENEIFDPATQQSVNGMLVRDPFPNNTIPANRLDPVALKIQSLIPLPTQNGLVNNGVYPFTNNITTTIPSLKLDHLLNSRQKLSFYWQWDHYWGTAPGNGLYEGFPQPISQGTLTHYDAHIWRLNYDNTLSPTKLLHLGIGYADNFNRSLDETRNFNPTTQLGLQGPFTPYAFPSISGLNSPQGGVNPGQSGGSNSLGPIGAIQNTMQKTTAVASLSWVRNNHTFKTGAELQNDGFPAIINQGTDGVFAFSAAETGQPYLNNTTLAGGNVGFPYASFLLGLVDSGNIRVPTAGKLGKHELGFYVQDTWKVTRKFTLDYGLRYDYSTPEREQYGRLPSFSRTLPNPSAGGQPGSVIYEATCKCTFAHTYPWAFGPRLGFAYQVAPHTVVRGGAGIIYNGTDNDNKASSNVTSTNPFNSPGFGQPAMTFAQGVPFTAAQIAWPNFSPGEYPSPGTLSSPPLVVDPNAGRPARLYQWSIGVQREVSTNLVIDATYVGNRGIWWQAPTQVNYNAITPDMLAAHGLNINSPADQQLLISPLNSPLAISRGFGKPPYSGFPLSATVAQSLRPFPQFAAGGGATAIGAASAAGLTPLWAPLGDTWYDALQVKVSKRLSHGLEFTYVFTWQKTLDIGAESDSPAGSSGQVNNVFNRRVNKYLSVYDQPFVSTLAVNYTVPRLKINRALSWLIRDWQIGIFQQDASGTPILSPVSTNNLGNMLFQSTFDNRVPGVPLFTANLNCHCFDPNKTFVLNPAAWVNPPAGQFGTAAAYYSDYRTERRPVENLGLGRIFRIREGVTLNIRAEFTNVLNRTETANPTSTNVLATQTRNGAGQATAGFGWINTATLAAAPRQGDIIARFRF